MNQQTPQHDPKPPELIENLRWLRIHGLRHWPYVLVALCIGIAVVTYKLGFFEKTTQTQQSLELNEWPDYRGCKSESPYGDPPLLVKFSDGKEAYVNFRVIVQMDLAKASNAAKVYHAPFEAYEALSESIKGAVYTELEKHTESFVRKNRSALATKIIKATRPIQDRTAFVLHEFDFLEFCTPNSSRNSGN